MKFAHIILITSFASQLFCMDHEEHDAIIHEQSTALVRRSLLRTHRFFRIPLQRLKTMEVSQREEATIEHEMSQYYQFNGFERVVDKDKLLSLYLNVLKKCEGSDYCVGDQATYFYNTNNIRGLILLNIKAKS